MAEIMYFTLPVCRNLEFVYGDDSEDQPSATSASAGSAASAAIDSTNTPQTTLMEEQVQQSEFVTESHQMQNTAAMRSFSQDSWNRW